jgi:hypothetical protein
MEEAQVTESPLARLQKVMADRRRGPQRAYGAREARRANERALKRERSKYIRNQQSLDGKIITDKKAWLKRHYGNPARRNDALVSWFVVENAKRGYE